MPIKTADFINAKARGHIWSMLTAYDAPTAEILDKAGIDFALVGDSLATVILGHARTADVTMEEMLHHAKAVRRGAKRAWVIADMPLKGLENGPRHALRSARRFMQEAGCDGVKIEWSPRAAQTTRLLVRNRIPVMGHVGLTPQTAKQFVVHGATAEEARMIFMAARRFEAEGAFSVLMECVPSAVAATITPALTVPTIGIGAGPACNGQVLVINDVVGTFTKFRPRFVKRYANLEPLMVKAVAAFKKDVSDKKFPGKSNEFAMNPKEWAAFQRMI